MAHACPLIFRQVDGTVVRLNAVSASVLLVLFLSTAQPLWLYLLATDLVIRLYGSKSYSPLNGISLQLQRMLRLESQMSDAGAKRLAAHFGLLFTLLLLAGHYLQLELFNGALAAVFLSCLGMEIVLNYCVGCKIYFLIKKLYPGF